MPQGNIYIESITSYKDVQSVRFIFWTCLSICCNIKIELEIFRSSVHLTPKECWNSWNGALTSLISDAWQLHNTASPWRRSSSPAHPHSGPSCPQRCTPLESNMESVTEWADIRLTNISLMSAWCGRKAIYRDYLIFRGWMDFCQKIITSLFNWQINIYASHCR